MADPLGRETLISWTEENERLLAKEYVRQPPQDHLGWLPAFVLGVIVGSLGTAAVIVAILYIMGASALGNI